MARSPKALAAGDALERVFLRAFGIGKSDLSPLTEVLMDLVEQGEVTQEVLRRSDPVNFDAAVTTFEARK